MFRVRAAVIIPKTGKVEWREHNLASGPLSSLTKRTFHAFHGLILNDTFDRCNSYWSIQGEDDIR